MAEFQEVMREWVRARKSTNENKLIDCPLEIFTNDRIANIEKEVMMWAAEHPEPKYPTWGDWLAEMKLVSWEDNGDGIHSVMVPTFKMCTRIPADIAQKLGIEPVEER